MALHWSDEELAELGPGLRRSSRHRRLAAPGSRRARVRREIPPAARAASVEVPDVPHKSAPRARAETHCSTTRRYSVACRSAEMRGMRGTLLPSARVAALLQPQLFSESLSGAAPGHGIARSGQPGESHYVITKNYSKQSAVRLHDQDFNLPAGIRVGDAPYRSAKVIVLGAAFREPTATKAMSTKRGNVSSCANLMLAGGRRGQCSCNFRPNSGPPSFRLDFSCLPPRGLQIEPRTFGRLGRTFSEPICTRFAKRSAPAPSSTPRLRSARWLRPLASRPRRRNTTRCRYLAIRARRGDHGSVLSPLGRGL